MDVLEKYIKEFSVDEQDGMRVNAVLNYDAGFEGFQGHFPGQPILPAVIQMASVRFLAEKALKKTLVPVATRRIKFSAIIGPAEEVVYKLAITNKGGTWETAFRILKAGDTKVASGVLTFKEPEKGD